MEWASGLAVTHGSDGVYSFPHYFNDDESIIIMNVGMSRLWNNINFIELQLNNGRRISSGYKGRDWISFVSKPTERICAFHGRASDRLLYQLGAIYTPSATWWWFLSFFVKNRRRRRRRNVHNSERNVCTRTGSWKQMTSRMKMRPLITTYQYSFYYSCIVLEFLWRGWRIPDSTRLTCERDDTPTSPNVVSLSSKTQQRRCAIVWGNMGNAHMVYLTREDIINQIYICIKYRSKKFVFTRGSML